MTEGRRHDLTVKRWWWAPTTVLITAALGGLLVAVESCLGFAFRSALLGTILLAHVVAAAVLATLMTIRNLSSGDIRFVDRSNPFWKGVWYGFLVAVATPVVAGALLASSLSEVVPAIGAALFMSVVSFEFLLMCLIGALTWAVLSRKRSRNDTGDICRYGPAWVTGSNDADPLTNPEA